MKKYLYSISILVALIANKTNAQDDKNKKSSVGTEVVNVTSEYQATLNDAFKINDNPLIEDEDINQKKNVKYTIFSVPVASTFSPAKGQAAAVDTVNYKDFYRNYALLGLGTYNTIQAELGVVEEIGAKNMYVGGLLKYHTTDGKIPDIVLDNAFNQANLDFFVGKQNNNNNWKAQFGASNANYNWYGTPASFNTSNFNYNMVDPAQKYTGLHVLGTYESYIRAIDKVDVLYKHFTDNYSSKESRLVIAPKFNLQFAEQSIHLNLEADYVNTKFTDNGLKPIEDAYSYLNLTANPNLKFYDENYSVQIGLGLTYILGKANGIENNNLAIFPTAKANFNLVPDILQVYLGAEGGVKQNSYADIVAQNPYVAPTLNLMPTKTNFDFYAGMKGKLYHNLSYNVRASYKSESDKAMFTINPYDVNLNNKQGYQYGNSFGIIYDDVNTLNLFGELNFDFNNKAVIAVSAEVNSFEIKNYQNVYHVPQGKINLNALYNINQKWYTNVDLGYIGQRYEFNGDQASLFDDIKLGDYYDVNVTVGYRPTTQWTVFAKGLNLVNENYYRFNQYQVQGLQVMAGAMYKFNL